MSDRTPTVSYVITEENLTQAIVRGTTDAHRSVRLRYAAYSAVMLVAWFFLHPISVGMAPILLLYGAFVFAVLALIRPWLVRRQIRSFVKDRPDLDRRIELRIAGGSFHINVPGVLRSEQALATLHSAVSGTDGTLVQTFPNEYMWVPASAFDSADDRTLFDRTLLAGLRIPDPAL